MKVADVIAGVDLLFLDTAPVIYHIEANPKYFERTVPFFRGLRDGELQAATSSITLLECLVYPFRTGDAELAGRFRRTIKRAANTRYIPVDPVVEPAAELRARYNLTATDALQVAAAIAEGCDAILTNDIPLKRVKEIRIILVDDLEL